MWQATRWVATDRNSRKLIKSAETLRSHPEEVDAHDNRTAKAHWSAPEPQSTCFKCHCCTLLTDSVLEWSRLPCDTPLLHFRIPSYITSNISFVMLSVKLYSLHFQIHWASRNQHRSWRLRSNNAAIRRRRCKYAAMWRKCQHDIRRCVTNSRTLHVTARSARTRLGMNAPDSTQRAASRSRRNTRTRVDTEHRGAQPPPCTSTTQRELLVIG